MPFTPKQYRYIMMTLRKQGLLKKVLRSGSTEMHKAFAPGAVSKYHVKSFSRLLDHGSSVEEAVEKTRLGGGFPKIHEFLAQISAKKVGRRASFDSVPGYDDIEAHPLILKSWKRWSPEVQRDMGEHIGGWFGGYLGYEIRDLVNRAIGDLPLTKIARPEWLKKTVRARLAIKARGGIGMEADLARMPMPGKRRFSPGLVDAVKDLYTDHQAVLGASHPGGTITLHRGVIGEEAERIRKGIGEHGVVILPADTLSSWSESRTVAAGFSKEDGIVISVSMPVERSVFSDRSVVSPPFWDDLKEHVIFGDRFWLKPEEVSAASVDEIKAGRELWGE